MRKVSSEELNEMLEKHVKMLHSYHLELILSIYKYGQSHNSNSEHFFYTHKRSFHGT